MLADIFREDSSPAPCVKCNGVNKPNGIIPHCTVHNVNFYHLLLVSSSKIREKKHMSSMGCSSTMNDLRWRQQGISGLRAAWNVLPLENSTRKVVSDYESCLCEGVTFQCLLATWFILILATL